MADFMTAKIEIDGMIEKKNAIMTKVGNLVAEACMDRANKGKISQNLEKDIINLIRELPAEDQAQALLKALVAMTNSTAGKGGSQREERRQSRSDIFSNRGYY